MKIHEALIVVWFIVGGFLTATYKSNWFVGHDFMPVVYGISVAGIFVGIILIDLINEYKIVRKY